MSDYISRIENAAPINAPKTAGTKDAIYGRLLQAMKELHVLEQMLHVQRTKPELGEGEAVRVFVKSEDRIRFEEAAQRVKDRKARERKYKTAPLSAEEAAAFAEGRLEVVKPRAPSTLKERREAMNKARCEALATGHSVKAY